MMYWSFGEVLNSSILEGKRHLTRERFYKSALCHDVISREEYNRMKAIMRGQWRKKLPETQNASI